MQVTESSAEGLRRQYKILIPAAEIEDRISEQLETLRRDMRLPGFRPGKVPAALVRKRYGDDVRREVVQETISKSADKVLESEGVRAAATPDIDIESQESGQDLTFTMSMEVMPDIEIGDISAIKIDREVPVVGEALVEETVQKLAEGNKRFEPLPADHAAAEGEVVKANVSATAAGESVEALAGTDQYLPVGTSAVAIVPALQEQLVGLRAGDSKEITVTLPEDFAEASLQGKTVTFTVDVTEVAEEVTPALDDDLGKRMGFESLADLHRTCRERLEQQFRSLARLRAKRRLLDRLADDYQFPVPESMIEGEFDGIWQRIQSDKEEGRLSDEDKEKTDEDLRAEYRSIAERRVRLGLFLAEVGKRNEIEVTSEELRQAMIREAQNYPGQEGRVLEFFKQHPQAIHNLRAPLFEEKVVDFILEMADVADTEIDAEELRRKSEEGDV